MKRFLIPFALVLLFAASFVPTQANQESLATHPCSLAGQVAYNRAFQEEYAKDQDLGAADQAGSWAYIDAMFECFEGQY